MEPRGFDLVQPILVPRSGSHEHIVAAVGTASLLAYLTDPGDPRWNRWLQSAPAKTVRRVKGQSHITQVRQWAQEVGAAHAHICGVLALAPLSYDEMPKRVRGSQVNGIDYPRVGSSECKPSGAGIEVLTLVSLSTGKAAAQVAHAVWGWHRTDPQWEPAAGFHLSFVTPAELGEAAQSRAGVTVYDAGFTEVDPGTLTAVARPV